MRPVWIQICYLLFNMKKYSISILLLGLLVSGFVRMADEGEVEPYELVFDLKDVSWAIVQLVDRTVLRRDIEALARAKTPAAVLARMPLALE